jgi:hypothetical protein
MIMNILFIVIGFICTLSPLAFAQETRSAKPPQLFAEVVPSRQALRNAVQVTNSTVNVIDSLRTKPWIDSVKVVRLTMDFRALLTQRSITLNFFGGDSFTAQRTKIQPLAENVFSWQGNIPSHKASINLIIRPESLRGDLHLAEHVFRIETLADKSLLIYRVNTMKLPPIEVD